MMTLPSFLIHKEGGRNEINPQKDNQLYKSDFNFIKTKEENRFILEEFLDYDIILKVKL